MGAPAFPALRTGAASMRHGRGRRAILLTMLTLFASAVSGSERREAASPDIHFSEDGILVSRNSHGPSPPDWGLILNRYGKPGHLRTAGPPHRLQDGDGRLELSRGPLVEWFRNGASEIEHGLELRGWGTSSLLFFEYELPGNLVPKVSEDGLTATFSDPSGSPAWLDLDLRAVDMEGREVAARWERIEPVEDAGPAIRLVLEGADHRLPLSVFARLTTPEGWSASILSTPSNDLCSGAEIIPGSGPFPYLSTVVDVTDATTTGDPAAPSCQSDVSRSVWFSFTPAVTALYDLSVCAEAPTATTLEDTVLAVYTESGSCSGLAEIAGGCSDDACGPTALQSALTNLYLSAGTTYRMVVWSFGATAPPGGSAGVQLSVVRHALPGPAPPNDQCGGAEIIPGAGPFPHLTAITSDIGGATTVGDPPAPSCQPNVSRSVWYSFTPAAGGRYGFSLCADGPSGTTVDDTVVAIYSETGPCSGLTQVSGGCDDDSCSSEAAQSRIAGITLIAGVTYDVVVWKYGSAAPAAGNTAVQMRVSQINSLPNDTCDTALDLPLNQPAPGSTIASADDLRLPPGSTCFGGTGQSPSTAPGGDVAYRFTALQSGRYSFRVSGYDASRNVVLYVSSDCPSGPSPQMVSDCLGAANRTATSPEEVSCVPLAAGQSVYVHVDEDAVTTGSSFTIEATGCTAELEPDGSPALAAEAACGAQGSISPAGDSDFFRLGIPGPGSRVFALVDGAAANSTDFDLRVTTAADTLEYDDFNNDVAFGSVSPNVAGTRLTGAPSYLRVNHYSPTAQAEPYRLYASVQPPSAGATLEVEPNNTVATATHGTNDYFTGVLADTTDVDLFAFSAVAGELLQIGLDLDPTRNNTPFNGSLALLDASGATLLLVNDTAFSSSNAPGAGSLAATTPYAPGEALVYRVRTSGSYAAKVAWSSGTPGDYLLSIAHDCRVLPATDLAVTQIAAPDPVAPGGDLSFSITVSNLGVLPAPVATLRDDLPVGAEFLSASTTRGICSGTGPIVCDLGDLAAGAGAELTIAVRAPLSPGSATNGLRVATAAVDANPSNDLSLTTTMIGSGDADGDGVPDAADCAPSDASVWAVPGEATSVAFSGPATLTWSAPASLGGTSVSYDLVRSATPGDFQSPACPASGVSVTSAADIATPGRAFYYLVRARNVCGSNSGASSAGVPRAVGTCG